mmetsp:Transcript_35232/g.105244  ORF Transcript_35232/g.105244 Transcript_35232/m.105244 type:complete len:219 (-) Transcript_35232:1127-1783(-)
MQHVGETSHDSGSGELLEWIDLLPLLLHGIVCEEVGNGILAIVGLVGGLGQDSRVGDEECVAVIVEGLKGGELGVYTKDVAILTTSRGINLPQGLLLQRHLLSNFDVLLPEISLVPGPDALRVRDEHVVAVAPAPEHEEYDRLVISHGSAHGVRFGGTVRVGRILLDDVGRMEFRGRCDELLGHVESLGCISAIVRHGLIVCGDDGVSILGVETSCGQ